MRKPKPGRKKVKGLTHKQRVYVQTKILTGSKSEALKAALYCQVSHMIRVDVCGLIVLKSDILNESIN